MPPISLRPVQTGPQPTDVPHRDCPVRLPARSVIAELVLGSLLAAVLSLTLQFVVSRSGITEPSFAPEALATTAVAVVLAVLFGALTFGHRHSPRWLRLGATWSALTAIATLALSLPLQASRFYYGGASVDNGFRLQYMERMASTPGLADMNYAGVSPYYPAGWFWLGGRFANLLGWDGWAAYKPYTIACIAVTGVAACTLWSVVLRRRLALLAAVATVLSGLLNGYDEPYAWMSAALVAPVAVIAWHALRCRTNAHRVPLVGVGLFVGFGAITYTLYTGFYVLALVAMTLVIGVLRVRAGEGWRATVRALLPRLVLVGVVSLVVALLVWLPFLVSSHVFLSAGKSYAQHYLPENGAYLPTPMLQGNALGVISLAGLVWMIVRARRNEVAAALLFLVITVYCWFALSTLALLAKTTLLAFRLNVILDAVLLSAGVFGLLELIALLRRRLDGRYATHITAVACALGLLGAISLTQTALSDRLDSSAKTAYNDYYPTGVNARGEHDPAKQGAWNNELIHTIRDLSGRRPQNNVLLNTYYTLMSFRPYWGFQQSTPHYANPLAHYDARNDLIRSWATSTTPRQLLSRLDRSPFTPPNVFVLYRDPDGLKMRIHMDGFPQFPNVRSEDVRFDPALFADPHFVRRDVGPFTVIARR